MIRIAFAFFVTCFPLLYSPNSIASTSSSYAARCDGCTAQQAKQAATAIAMMYKSDAAATAAGYYGYVYSYDFATGTITQYGVVLSTKLAQLVAMPTGQPVPGIIANSFSAQRTAALAHGGANAVYEMHDDVTRFPSFPGRDLSAVDIASTGKYQNDISDWLLDGASLNEWSIVAAAEVLILKGGLELTLDMVWTMSDGGKITMRFTAGEFKFKLVAATDANNNPVPLTADNVPGRYKFDKGGGSSFGDYLHDRFGYGINGGPVCKNGYLACSEVSGMRSCTWYSCSGAGS